MAKKYVKVFYDWEEVTSTLSDAERGRLITALVLYARSGEIIELCGAERHVFPTLRAQVDRDNESYEKSIKNGTLGGAPIGNKNAQTSKNNLKQPKTSENNQDKDKDKDKEEDKDNKKPSTRMRAFEEFWLAYPKKVGKEAARKAFSKIESSVFPLLIPAIAVQKTSSQWQRDKGQYIPNPATWLNQGRWADEQQEVLPIKAEKRRNSKFACVENNNGLEKGGQDDD